MNDDFETLKAHLPVGFTRVLAKEFGVTDVTISNSLNGKTKRFDIIERAIEMAKENLEIKNRLKEFAEEVVLAEK